MAPPHIAPAHVATGTLLLSYGNVVLRASAAEPLGQPNGTDPQPRVLALSRRANGQLRLCLDGRAAAFQQVRCIRTAHTQRAQYAQPSILLHLLFVQAIAWHAMHTCASLQVAPSFARHLTAMAWHNTETAHRLPSVCVCVPTHSLLAHVDVHSPPLPVPPPCPAPPPQPPQMPSSVGVGQGGWLTGLPPWQLSSAASIQVGDARAQWSVTSSLHQLWMTTAAWDCGTAAARLAGTAAAGAADTAARRGLAASDGEGVFGEDGTAWEWDDAADGAGPSPGGEPGLPLEERLQVSRNGQPGTYPAANSSAASRSPSSKAAGGSADRGAVPPALAAMPYPNQLPVVSVLTLAVAGGGTGADGEAFVGQVVTVSGAATDADGDRLRVRLTFFGVPTR